MLKIGIIFHDTDRSKIHMQNRKKLEKPVSINFNSVWFYCMHSPYQSHPCFVLLWKLRKYILLNNNALFIWSNKVSAQFKCIYLSTNLLKKCASIYKFNINWKTSITMLVLIPFQESKYLLICKRLGEEQERQYNGDCFSTSGHWKQSQYICGWIVQKIVKLMFQHMFKL